MEKQIKTERFQEDAQMYEDNEKNKPKKEPVVNLQVYQANQQLEYAKKQAGTYMPLPQLPASYLPFPGYGGSYSYPLQMVPIINNFKIESKGPLDNHARLSMIYEDILPSKKFMTSIDTLDERIHMYEFVRSVLIKDKDGEDMMVFSNNYNTLLNYIKFMDLNPYNTNIYSPNPYQGLPLDMLLYRSCYPIRYNRYNSSVMCSKNSIGVNIRIYKLSDIELQIFYNKNSGAAIPVQTFPNLVLAPTNIQTVTIEDFHIWREVAYYEYVRENIIKKKISPNFVIIYSFNIVLTPFIDFNKLAIMRGAKSKPDGKYKGKSLIVITESPTHNLYGWSSSSYQLHNNIKKMVYTGFYSEKIWFVVLFQLMAALYTMQKYGFIFHDFSVEDNVYIKDLSIDPTNIKYWKYRIDNIDYFIPNYGYLVMIDSKFKDIMKTKLQIKKEYKVYGKFLNNPDVPDIEDRCFQALEKSFSKNIFSQAFLKNGGVLPPDNVMSFIDKTNSEINNGIANKTTTPDYNNIGKYIKSRMRFFMNNRIGTILKTQEVEYRRQDDRSKFTKGQIIVHEYANKNFKFVLFDEYEQGTSNCHILTKSSPSTTDIISETVPSAKLSNYSAMETITQNFKIGEVNFNEDNLLEIYNI